MASLIGEAITRHQQSNIVLLIISKLNMACLMFILHFRKFMATKVKQLLMLDKYAFSYMINFRLR